MTGLNVHKMLKIDLQAWAVGTSLLTYFEDLRTEKPVKK